jgi:hypothetical protein
MRIGETYIRRDTKSLVLRDFGGVEVTSMPLEQALQLLDWLLRHHAEIIEVMMLEPSEHSVSRPLKPEVMKQDQVVCREVKTMPVITYFYYHAQCYDLEEPYTRIIPVEAIALDATCCACEQPLMLHV